MAGYDVTRIERIENGEMQEQLDAAYGTNKRLLAGVGVDVEGGTHTRWLFHGTPSSEALDDIVSDPKSGFNPLLADKQLWGAGLYFARDSAYSIDYCSSCVDSDGQQMMMLCLVTCGLPCVGEEGLKIFPKVHPGMLPKVIRYGSFVDSAANPEIFVVDTARDVYPAYIVHYS